MVTRPIVSKYQLFNAQRFTSFVGSLHRVERDEPWSLFCPSEAETLLQSSGAKFNQYLLGYEVLNVGVVYQARDIWSVLIAKAIEPNGPCIMYTDTVNSKRLLIFSEHCMANAFTI